MRPLEAMIAANPENSIRNRVRNRCTSYNRSKWPLLVNILVCIGVFIALIFVIIHAVGSGVNTGPSPLPPIPPGPPTPPNPVPTGCDAVCPEVSVQNNNVINDPTAPQGTFLSEIRQCGNDAGIRELQEYNPATFAPAQYMDSQCSTVDSNFSAVVQAFRNLANPLKDLLQGKPTQSSANGNVQYSYDAYQSKANQVTRTSLANGQVKVVETAQLDQSCDRPFSLTKNQTTNCTTSAVMEPLPMSAFQAGLGNQTGFVVKAKPKNSNGRVCCTTFMRALGL